MFPLCIPSLVNRHHSLSHQSSLLRMVLPLLELDFHRHQGHPLGWQWLMCLLLIEFLLTVDLISGSTWLSRHEWSFHSRSQAHAIRPTNGKPCPIAGRICIWKGDLSRSGASCKCLYSEKWPTRCSTFEVVVWVCVQKVKACDVESRGSPYFSLKNVRNIGFDSIQYVSILWALHESNRKESQLEWIMIWAWIDSVHFWKI